MIKLESVNFKINNFEILKNINLEIKVGSILGIVGKSGAGKSSLIRVINGLVKISGGNVLIEGNKINDLPEKKLNEYRRKMGMIFQHFNLLEQKNVYENIKLTLEINGVDETVHEERVDELLNLVGLIDKKYNYPKTLSGGEKQRVAIARAIANNPKYLLADEATSALDLQTSKEILDLLSKINLKYGVTIIFVSHDLNAIKYLCEEVVFMDKGEIVEQNTIINLFKNPKHELTKKLVNEKVYRLFINNKTDLYQITYDNKNSNKPIISNLIKNYNVSINILYGEVMEVNKMEIGFLYVNIFGEDKEKAINQLKKEVEVIKYV